MTEQHLAERAFAHPDDQHLLIGSRQAIMNELVEDARLVLEDIVDGHKRVIIAAMRSCGCCVRVEACNSHVLICKASRLLEYSKARPLQRVFGEQGEPELYDGPQAIDGRGWGREVTPRRESKASVTKDA